MIDQSDIFQALATVLGDNKQRNHPQLLFQDQIEVIEGQVIGSHEIKDHHGKPVQVLSVRRAQSSLIQSTASCGFGKYCEAGTSGVRPFSGGEPLTFTSEAECRAWFINH